MDDLLMKTSMKPYIFDFYETDDIVAVLSEVEEYFHFKLEDDELAHVKTFDEFIDTIIDKLPYKDSNTCTSQ